MTFDSVGFLAGLYATPAVPRFDPDDDGGPDAVTVAMPTSPDRAALAGFIREARRAGDRDRATDALEAYRERVGIMQFDGERRRRDAEASAAADVLAGLRAEPAADAEPDPLAGLVNPGWTPRGWRDRLRQIADACQAVRPDLAAEHRTNADRINAISEGHERVTGKSTVIPIQFGG